jgi:hypothetical protein
MRFPQPIDSVLHGATDYTMGALLMGALPRLAGIGGTRAGRQIRIAGAAHAGYSTVTDYPLGVVKVLPYKAHLAIDALGAVALGAAPFVSGEFREGRSRWVPHVALAAFELMAVAMSDPSGRGDRHGDVDALRSANSIDPGQKIRSGGPAVTPAAS